MCVRERLPVGCIAGCMRKEPLALPDQGVLLAHIRALPLVIYIYVVSTHTFILYMHVHTLTYKLVHTYTNTIRQKDRNTAASLTEKENHRHDKWTQTKE